MKFINFAVVKFAICLTLGIVTGHYFPSFGFFFQVMLPLVLLLGLLWWFQRKALVPSIFFGLLSYCCFFSLGYFNYQQRLPLYTTSHYSTHLTEAETPQLLQLKIAEILKPDTFNHKYVATVQKVDDSATTGKLLVAIKKDSATHAVSIDNLLVVTSAPKRLAQQLNPAQFDYAKYMQTLGVYHQIRINNNEILVNTKGSSSLRGIAEYARNFLLQKLETTKLSLDERAIIQALVLGQRREISKELYQSYAAAGAIHILAVSGLHVGILYFILLFLLKPLHYLKHGNVLQSIVVVVLLWCFAFVTGLSPSVTRAITMFSLFAFAGLLQRRTSTINTLFLSYFILLLVNPLWLFHVGFQLSYLAVFFILWVQPKLYSYYSPSNRFTKLIWSIFTVTIAAQLGIVPLSLFYFHQFPGLFFITNIVVLPVLGALLGGGILVITLAVLGILPDWMALSYNGMVKLLNDFIRWIASKDSFIITDIPFSETKVVAAYLLLIALIVYWKKLHFKRLVFLLTSITIVLVVFIWEKKQTAGSELVIFQKSKHTIIGYKNNNELTVFANNTLPKLKNTYPLKSYKTDNSVSSLVKSRIPSVLRYDEKFLVIIDSSGVYPSTISPDYVLLTHSPKVNLQRLLDSLQPKEIIADGSNYTSYVKRWEATCLKNKIPFHHTGKKGAFVLK